MSNGKIAHLTSVHSALDGRIFKKECRSLASAGFEVTVVGPYTEDTVKDKVQVKSIQREGSKLSRMLKSPWRVYQEARKLDADVYHFHDPELIPVGLLLRAQGKKVIYDVHEDLPRDVLTKPYLPAWSKGAISGFLEALETFAGKQFTALVTVTPTIAERLQKLNQRTVIIHNYPFAEELVSGYSAAWDTRDEAVAYVGNVNVERAIREMIFAMGELPDSLPATLEIAGTPIPPNANPEELKQSKGWSRVKHHGILDQPSTWRILQRVRAGLVIFRPVPNHTEALPQKIFEYMGAGIPVIMSDFPYWHSLLDPFECALFVDPLDPKAIAKAIEHVLTHPREAEEMGRRGQAAVLEHYNWNSEAKKLVGLYSSLLGEPSPA